MRIIEHTPTQLVVGSDSYGPRVGGVVSILIGIATVVILRPRWPISLAVGAVFVLSGLAGLRRSYVVSARFDRDAQLLRFRGDSVRIPLGDVTGLRLVRMSAESSGADAFVELRTGEVLPLGSVDSPEAPALKQIQQFLVLPDATQTDLRNVTGLKRFVLRTGIMWGVSPVRLSGLISAWTRPGDETETNAGCAYCRSQSPLDGAFCRECGSLLANPSLGVRAPLGRRLRDRCCLRLLWPPSGSRRRRYRMAEAVLGDWAHGCSFSRLSHTSYCGLADRVRASCSSVCAWSGTRRASGPGRCAWSGANCWARH
jgi:hypothetical protein